jgi:MFS family permease
VDYPFELGNVDSNTELSTTPAGPSPRASLRARVAREVHEYFDQLGMFSRNARLFLWGSFLLSLAFSMFQLMRNLYLKEAGFGEVFIGETLSVFSLGSLLGSVPAAILLLRRRTKPALMLTTLGAGAGYFGIATLLSGWGILGASLAAGVMMSVYQVAAAPFLMSHSTVVERTHLFSANFAVRTAAGVIGSFGGGYLYHFVFDISRDAVWGYRTCLLVGVGVAILAIVPFAMIRERAPVPQPNPFARRYFSLRKGLYTKLVLPFFLLGLGAGLVIPFLNLYFRNRFNQDGDSIGVFFGIMQFCMTFGIMAGPPLARRWGLVRTIVYTELASVPFMIVLAYTGQLYLAVGAFLLRGMLMNMAQPLATNFTMEVVTPSEQPLVNSLTQMAWLGSWMISAALGGSLIERFGFAPPLLATVALYIASSGLYYLFFHSFERSEHVRLPLPLTDLKG